MDSRITSGITVVLLILLMGAIVYPGVLTSPYENPTPRFSIAHESTEEFNDIVKDKESARQNAVPLDELSESQRRAFETAKEQDPSPYSGRQSFRLPICKDIVLICNEYREAPEEPRGGSTYGVVEDSDGDLYTVRVGFGGERAWNFNPAFEFVSKLLSLGAFFVLLSNQYWSENEDTPTPTALGYGIALIAFVFVYTYLPMFLHSDLMSGLHFPILMFLPMVTWGVIGYEILSHGENEMNT